MPEQKMTRFTPAEARKLVATGRQSMLSTLRADGSPYGSYVSHAMFADGSPLLFISKLAWHTRHLERDGRASLLILGEKAQADALMTAATGEPLRPKYFLDYLKDKYTAIYKL